ARQPRAKRSARGSPRDTASHSRLRSTASRRHLLELQRRHPVRANRADGAVVEPDVHVPTRRGQDDTLTTRVVVRAHPVTTLHTHVPSTSVSCSVLHHGHLHANAWR